MTHAIGEELRSLVHERKSEDKMLKYVRESTQSLMDSGIARVIDGTTSLDEVIRVTRVQ